jgi:aminoglycoside 3-N-acetyltransferase
MVSWLPKLLKQSAKDNWKKLRVACTRRFCGFNKSDLQMLLRRLGMSRGDVVFVHSSLDQFEGFQGKFGDILSSLQEILGPEGTLLVPTLPFTGSAVEYVQERPIFDVSKTPSRMGLLTELFRRSPGVVRSIHPTHSVAAWGAKALHMTANHYLAETPCGRQSPYASLLDHGGKILFLGTDISVMTFFHMVEEELEPTMPFSPFTKEFFSLKSRDSNGNEFTTRTRLFDPAYSRLRNLQNLLPVLRSRGLWKEGRVGRLRVILLSAESVLSAARSLAEKGTYCYDV